MVSPVVAIGLGSLALGLLLVGLAGRALGGPLAVLRTPERRVFSLTEDLDEQVLLRGEVAVAEGTVASPFTGADCVAVVVEVHEDTANDDSMREVASGRATRPFHLVDDSGSVLVDPAEARLALDADDREFVHAGEEPSAGVRRYIEATESVDEASVPVRLGPLSIDLGSDRRYTERRLEPGDPVAVVGTPGWTEGAVGAVNATVADGDPFVVGDGGRTGLVAASLLSYALIGGFGLLFVGIGAVVVAAGLGVPLPEPLR